jgi:hypothetical protein
MLLADDMQSILLPLAANQQQCMLQLPFAFTAPQQTFRPPCAAVIPAQAY